MTHSPTLFKWGQLSNFQLNKGGGGKWVAEVCQVPEHIYEEGT